MRFYWTFSVSKIRREEPKSSSISVLKRAFLEEAICNIKHFRLCQALVHTASPSPLAAGSLPEMTPCHPHHLLCPHCPPLLAARRSCTSARSWSTWGTLLWPARRPATCPSSPGPGPAPTDQSVAPSRQYYYLEQSFCETKLMWCPLYCANWWMCLGELCMMHSLSRIL